MKGIDEYTGIVNNRIDNLIKENSDKKCLKGFANHLKLNKSENTTYAYLQHIIDFLDKTNKDLSDIEYDDYITYENLFVECTSSYRVVIHSALKAFAGYLYLSNIVPTNCMERSKAPKSVQKISTIEKRENNYLNPEEVQVYLQHVDAGVGSHRALKRQEQWRNRDKAIIAMFLNTGMRCSALYKLDVNDIDFESRELRVKEKGKIQLYILNNNVVDVLKPWLEDREKLLGGIEEDALFISNQRRRMGLQAISNVTQKYGQNVKDIHLTPHKLRATFGTQVQAMTGDIYLTKEAMGHSNIATTELYIRGQGRASKQKASDAMQMLFGSVRREEDSSEANAI